MKTDIETENKIKALNEELSEVSEKVHFIGVLMEKLNNISLPIWKRKQEIHKELDNMEKNSKFNKKLQSSLSFIQELMDTEQDDTLETIQRKIDEYNDYEK